MLRPKLNRIWTSSSPTLRRDPGDAKYIQGWISEIPTFQVLNYLQYKVDTTLLALAERGIAEWGPDVQYGLNSLAWDETNKVIYISTVGSPDRTKAPSTNPTQWVASSIQVSRAEYDSVVAAINAHIADVTGNPHKLTAGRLNAYNKTEIDNIVSQYRTLVANHANDKNNPHQLTATIIGAVPATGGTYTGDVTFNAGVWFDSGKVNGLVKTGGIYLKNGNGQIGISDAGVAQAGKIGALSPIVSEASFPNLKAAQEPNYAVPPPLFATSMMGSLNIEIGKGCVNTSFDPQYSAVTGALNLNSSDSNHSIVGTDELSTGKTFTIAVDLLAVTPRVPADTTKAFQFGIVNRTTYSGIYLHITGASLIRAERVTAAPFRYESAPYQLTGPINTWYRVVGVFSGSTIKLYLDGVLVSTAYAPATQDVTGASSPYGVRIVSKTAGNTRNIQARNFRLWAEALTEKQVSTL